MVTQLQILTAILFIGLGPAASAASASTNAGANAHSKATQPVHPTVKIPLDRPIAPAPVETTSSLSWQDAVTKTRKDNADLHAAQSVIEQYNATVNQAWGNFLPTVTATVGVQKSNTADQADADSATARVTLNENLFNGFGDSARIEQARRQRDNAQASYDLTQAQVSAQLKTAYQNLVIYDRFVRLTEDIIQRRQTNLNLVTLRFEGGRENKGSVLLSQANFEQAKLERLQASNNVESARVSLAKVLGEERLPFATVTDAVPVSVPPLQVDFEGLAAQAPELRQAIANARAAEAGVSVARSGFLPKLDLTAQAGRFGNQFFPNTDQGVISLGLTIPLFNGTKTYYGFRAAEAVAVTAEAQRLTALRTKIVEIRNAYNTFLEAVAQEGVAQSFVTAAETRAEIARAQYNTGLITFQDWDQIETDLVTRQRNALTSQANRVAAEAAWEQSQGQGLFNEPMNGKKESNP